MGGVHGGNTVMGSQLLPDYSHEIMYIDYEVAGFYPALLDLAKPICNGVFFDTFYRDLIPGI
jgi:thiamine kinase-like enzyme